MTPETNHPTPLAVVACQVMQPALVPLIAESLMASTVFLDYGLHRSPDLMQPRLQEVLGRIRTPSRVLLGYGLCGNGLHGLQAGEHTLIVPKVDDCIAILLGSRRTYRQQFHAQPGTYYLSAGWLEAGSHPLGEYREYAEAYGQADADWIMDAQYRHYKRLVFIAYSREELERYRPQALQVARYCQRWDMRYEEVIGSDRYFRRMIAILTQPQTGDDGFVVVPPGGRIRKAQFTE